MNNDTKMEINVIYNKDNLTGIKELPDGCIDMVMTSPPYDNLRTYKGFSWDFENLAKELYRVLKDGGIIAWVVADATINGSETGTSFRQALFFKDIGFNLHDTMIWDKSYSQNIGAQNRYRNTFEYIFIFSKGTPKTANLIKDVKNKWAGVVIHGTTRQIDGSTTPVNTAGQIISEYGVRSNVWRIGACNSATERTGHPAQYPEKLCEDLIKTWSNPDDLILDPFMGSGTTAVACLHLDRNYIGYEISEEYIRLAEDRIDRNKCHLWQ